MPSICCLLVIFIAVFSPVGVPRQLMFRGPSHDFSRYTLKKKKKNLPTNNCIKPLTRGTYLLCLLVNLTPVIFLALDTFNRLQLLSERVNDSHTVVTIHRRKK